MTRANRHTGLTPLPRAHAHLARVDYKIWKEGERPKRRLKDGSKEEDSENKNKDQSTEETFQGLYFDVRDIVFNYNEVKDVFPPYVSSILPSPPP